jgi:transposase
MDISLNFSVSITEDGSLVLKNANNGIVCFSKDQIVQRKVCMVALGELIDLPKIQIAKLFGYSTRKSYYDIRNDVLNGTGPELIPESPGPKSAPKRTKELEVLVIKMRFETDDNIDVIASKLNELGFKVSPRHVGQILMDYGLSKKKPLQP